MTKLTLTELLEATGGVLIQRNGSGVWYCHNGRDCGAGADRIEDIKHSETCPVKGIIVQKRI
jgi:hypothetical protein